LLKLSDFSKRTLISVRFIFLLIVVPFLINYPIIGPIVDHSRSQNESAIFLNYEMKKKHLLKCKGLRKKSSLRTYLVRLAQFLQNR